VGVSTVARTTPALSAVRLAVVGNAGLAAAAACLWIGMAIRGDFWRSDFSAFYTGWSITLDGHGERLYDFELQQQYQAQLLPERAESGALLPYVYPPQFVVFAPLALLPLPAAFYLWTAIQAALLGLILRWLWQDAHSWGPAAPVLAATTLLAFQPLFLTFQLGQQALISLVAIYGLVRALRDEQPLQSGAWLALACLKPQLALLPALYLIGSRQWRVLLTASALCIAWAAVATAVLGFHCWSNFLALTAFHARQFDSYGVFPLRGHNLKMLATAVLSPERLSLVNALTGVGLLGSAVAALLLGFVSRNAREPIRNLCLALTLFLAVLAAPHLNPHDDLLLLVPALLFYSARLRAGKPASLLAALLIACPLLFLFDSFGMDWWPSRVRPFFLVIAGVAVWAANDLVQLRTTASGNHSAAPSPPQEVLHVVEN
jgi:Glycosyltransferase family 87